MKCAWSGVFGIMAAAGFGIGHHGRADFYLAEPDQVALHRKTRGKMLAGHLCVNTCFEISAFAAPEFLVETDAGAINDQPDAGCIAESAWRVAKSVPVERIFG